MVPSESDLFRLYEELSKGGSPLPTADNHYARVALPDGTRITMRESVDNGPTIDVEYPPGVQGKYKVHIEDWPPPPPVTASVPSDSDGWGTRLSPEELREGGGVLGIMQKFRDAFEPRLASDGFA